MRTVDVDLSDVSKLAAVCRDYLQHRVCPIAARPAPAPLEQISLSVLLPGGIRQIWQGRVIQLMGSMQLIELAHPVDTQGLMRLAAAETEPAEREPDAAITRERRDMAEAQDEGSQAAGIDELAEEIVADRKGPVTGFESEYSDLYKRMQELSLQEKQALARRANRTARQLLIKDPNKGLHVLVIQNPKVTLDEVAEYSKLPGLSKDAARAIAQNRSWVSSRQVVLNLVRNPATPIELAVQLVGRLGTSEWRVLASATNVRTPVSAQARKLLFG